MSRRLARDFARQQLLIAYTQSQLLKRLVNGSEGGIVLFSAIDRGVDFRADWA